MLRKRFLINGEPSAGLTVHAEYLKPVVRLLVQLKARAAAGGLAQLIDRRVTERGVELIAATRFGQDEIRIDVPGYLVRPPTPTEEAPMPAYVTQLKIVGYTVWIIDGAGTGLVEYSEAGELTGRACPDLVGTPGRIRDVIYAHGALWVAFLTDSYADSAVLRVDPANGAQQQLLYTANSVSLRVQATASHILVLQEHNDGTVGRLSFVKPSGEIEAQLDTVYLMDAFWLFADDDYAYVAGQGADSPFGWQTGGVFVQRFSLVDHVATLGSFSDVGSPDGSDAYWALDQGGRVLLAAQDVDAGTYHDWQTYDGSSYEKIANYGWDYVTSSDPWLTCGDLLLKFHATSGTIVADRGAATVANFTPLATIGPVWDGDRALWMTERFVDYPQVTSTLKRLGFDGAELVIDLPTFDGFYLSPAIQLHAKEIEVPAAEATDPLPDELARRELRIVRSRSI